MPEDTKAEFPKTFMWGASTASHQVEGGTQNQWTIWEKTHAERLAKNAHKTLGWLPNWEKIKKQAESPGNYISGKGVDHFNRYKEDFDLAKKLNLNALRFGIEWSRLEPEEGVWDEQAIEHYRNYIEEMRKRKIEPIMNIWHWTMPVWFADKGGFAKRENIKYFERFVQRVGSEYAHHLKYVITINEPNVYASFSYQLGLWPPQQKSPVAMFRVFYNLAWAHRKAYRILKNIKPELQVGVAAQLGNIQARDPHDFSDELSTKVMRYFWNWWFLNRIRRCQDFVGINYYFTDYYDGLFRKNNPKAPLNDLGWYMEPEGLYPLMLRAWSHYNKPILISENGVADAADEYRRWWIEETIVAMERAHSEGVKIAGYLHWSLLDNFEWATGWWPKFGLIEVDREHDMKRTIRPSAKWFAERIVKLTSPQ
ncbi:MAG TPA: glycoside hydrolase family 1 protein [Candidatus Saccharimonadales bacterium]|nr:glycoside hydrolase family 1 protein [Candidatus Saccharimonadales bacterium]